MADLSAYGLIVLLQAVAEQKAICRLAAIILFSLVLLHGTSTSGQTTIPADAPTPQAAPQLQVNWLYGAYVPKDEPLNPLTGHERFKLFVRQSFTTYGTYAKTLLFSIGDQINDSPPAWGTDFDGYARRVGSREGQFVIQNLFVALGDGLLGYEPRYDICRCSGFWRRTGHAVARNFVTYDRTEQSYRPQLASYAGAFAAGVVAGTWKPSNRDLVAEGYRSAITQVGFGIAANWVGEFATDIKRIIRHKKDDTPSKVTVGRVYKNLE
jgi:hypothetical protein